MLVDIVVYDGIDELDALGPLEVLRSGATFDASVTARLVTPAEQDEVRGAFGLRFRPDARWAPGDADVTIVPGGGWAARADIGAWGEYRRGTLLELIADAARRSAVMAGVCTGTMLLAHAGVVGGRRAATHHAATADLAATGADVVRERVVDEGDLVTSGGVTAGIDLALWLLARECSADVAAKVAARMEHAWVRQSGP